MSRQACRKAIRLSEVPSMVVIFLPTPWLTMVLHERTTVPSIIIEQAPHCATPQPNLVPVSPIKSLIAHNKGMLSGALT